MKKEAYTQPSIESIKLELEATLLAGSDTSLVVDPIPDNGGIFFDFD